MSHRPIFWLLLPLLLVACASESGKTIASLDPKSDDFGSRGCQNARHNAWVHDEVKRNKVWVAPSVLFFVGPIAAVPVLATSIGLNAADHLQANDIALQCGGKPLTQTEVNKNIAIDSSIAIAIGGAAPALATVTKPTAP